MKLELTKEWCTNMAKREADAGDPDCSAGKMRTAYDWIDDIERMQGGPNGPTIRLRACVLEMDQQAFQLAAGQCANVVGDEGGTPQCKRIGELCAALADACELLEGWIGTKCPPRYQAEHMAHVEKLRGLLGPNVQIQPPAVAGRLE